MENQGLYSREEYMYRIENQKIEIFELIKYMLSKWKIGLGLCIVFFLICICFVVRRDINWFRHYRKIYCSNL